MASVQQVTISNSNPTEILPFPTNSVGSKSIDGSGSNNFPELLLLNCVKPVALLTKVVGLFPIRIKSDGSVQHKWFSKEVLYSLIYVFGFCGTSALFLPFVFYTIYLMNQEKGILSSISELIFFMGQYSASVCTLILNQWMAPRIACAWNKIQDVTAYFGKIQDGRKLYKSTFIITRALFIAWVLFLIGYNIFFLIYFWEHLALYYGKGQNPYFVLYVLGYILFCSQMSGHLLHIIIAGTFLRMLEHALQGLCKILPEAVHDTESFVKFYNTFGYIEQAVTELNTTFGAYTLVQIVVMMTSTLVNSYFTIFFNQGRHRGILMLMPPLLVLLYFLWLLRVCNSGERIQNQSKKAMKMLSNAAVFQLNAESNLKVAGLLGKLAGTPITVTAAGFVRINRRLMTKVVATMTTYLIFLVQIKGELNDHTPPCTNETISSDFYS